MLHTRLFTNIQRNLTRIQERIQYLKLLKQEGKLPSFVNIIEPIKCQSRQHLSEYFNSIIAKGGEGVMLNESQSLYKEGRSSSLRKYKPFFDTEVRVIENNYPHGLDCEQYNQLFIKFII